MYLSFSLSLSLSLSLQDPPNRGGRRHQGASPFYKTAKGQLFLTSEFTVPVTIRFWLKHTSRAVPLSESWLRGRPRGSTTSELSEITEITGPTPRHALMQILWPPRKSWNQLISQLKSTETASGNWRNGTLALGSQSFPQFDEMEKDSTLRKLTELALKS